MHHPNLSLAAVDGCHGHHPKLGLATMDGCHGHHPNFGLVVMDGCHGHRPNFGLVAMDGCHGHHPVVADRVTDLLLEHPYGLPQINSLFPSSYTLAQQQLSPEHYQTGDYPS